MADQARSGELLLVATPIGNLEDITLRALSCLREADTIAAEDTRRAKILCSRFEIGARLIPYHAHNEHRVTAGLLDEVDRGRRVAVLSDAGTPGIADPGFFIVREARQRGIEPVIVPGVSALTFAALSCGLPIDRFAFLGFPPVKSGRRRRFLETAKGMAMTVFIYEAPHRISRLLNEIREVMGGETPVALVREATKVHEECIRGTADELCAASVDRRWKGEFVVAVSLREAGAVEHDANEDRRTRRSKSPARSPEPDARPAPAP